MLGLKLKPCKHQVSLVYGLIASGLVTPYEGTDSGQHWLRLYTVKDLKKYV